MLRPHEPPAFEIVRPDARSRVVLICDHASNRIPEALGTLGLSETVLGSHVGWDIGAAVVARHLSELLDATLVLACYSRLVIDENRPVHVESAIPENTCGVAIPGNMALDHVARCARIDGFHRPYHDAIARVLDARTQALGGPLPVLLSIHSFTPVLLGEVRRWPIGLLYGRDTRIAHAFRERLRRDETLNVGDNEPYRVSEETDYAIPVHGLARGIPNTAFELRQDGVAQDTGARAWAERLAAIYREIEAEALI